MILTCYLVIGANESIKATKRPPSLAADEIAIGLTLNVPNALFSRPVLNAKIAIPADLVNDPNLEVLVDLTARDVARALKVDVDAVRDGLQEAVDRRNEDEGM